MPKRRVKDGQRRAVTFDRFTVEKRTVTVERFKVRQIAVNLVTANYPDDCPDSPNFIMCPKPSICGLVVISGFGAVVHMPPLKLADLKTILKELKPSKPFRKASVLVLASKGKAAGARAAIRNA
jgi:hypothetical protein